MTDIHPRLTDEQWDNYPQLFSLADILALKFDDHSMFARTLRFRQPPPIVRSYAPQGKVKNSSEGINRRLLEFMTGRQDPEPEQKRAAIASLEQQHPWLSEIVFPAQYYEKGMSDAERKQFVEDWLQDQTRDRNEFFTVIPLPNRERKSPKNEHKRSLYPNLPPAIAVEIAERDKVRNIGTNASAHYYEVEQAVLALLRLAPQKQLHLQPGNFSIVRDHGKDTLRLHVPDNEWQDQLMRSLEPHFRAMGMQSLCEPVYDESNLKYGGQAQYAVDVAIEDIASSPELLKKLHAHTAKLVDAYFTHSPRAAQALNVSKPLFRNIDDQEAAGCIKYCSEFAALGQSIIALSKLEGNKHPIAPEDIRQVAGDDGEGQILVVKMNPADTEGKTYSLLEKHFRLTRNGAYLAPARMAVDFDPPPTADEVREIQAAAGGPEASAEETGPENDDVTDPVSVIKIQADKMLGIDKATPTNTAATRRNADRNIGRFVDYVKKAVKPPRRVL